MVVSARRRLYAIPIEVVRQVFKPQENEVIDISADGSELIRRQGGLIPIVRLQDMGEAESQIGFEGAAAIELAPLSEQVIIVAESSSGVFGLPVDEVVGQQQVVMKPLQGHLKDIRGGVGCALLNTGEVAIAVDVEQLRRQHGGKPTVRAVVSHGS
jgi:two-component system chemotaxis sensor kinase CheA